MSHVCEAHTENPKPNDLNELYREQYFLSIFVGETPFMYIFIETYAFLVTKSNIFQQHGTQHPNYLQRQLLWPSSICAIRLCVPQQCQSTPLWWISGNMKFSFIDSSWSECLATLMTLSWSVCSKVVVFQVREVNETNEISSSLFSIIWQRDRERVWQAYWMDLSWLN